MKYVSRFLFATVLLFTTFVSRAQEWTRMLLDTNANYYNIVEAFDTYWSQHPYEKGRGYKAFKRWQWFVEPRVYPSGDLRKASRTYALEQVINTQDPQFKTVPQLSAPHATTANWTAVGPFGSPVNGDAGRVQAIRAHPTNTAAFYVGAAAGGFWMTTNGGLTYTTTTDQLGSCGVSDIAVNPFNTQILYISTGDKDAGDTQSIGVYKSTDGGLTWSPTGLAWSTSQQRRIYRLLINPLNPNTLFAATSVGVYRTLNAGQTWSLVSSASAMDAEYRPGDTTTIYVVTAASFIKSVNGGSSFSPVSISGLSGTNRLVVAVTPGNSSYVYILASNNNNGYGGVYRSVNAGLTFSLMSGTPNIFDWSANGSGTGGQGWYDIALDASPSNPNEIIAGGVNSWKSVNGGLTWSLNTHWTGAGGRPYVHADLHDVLYVSGTLCYLGTDGGVARSTNGGSTWTTINGNMNIAQMYKMGLSASTASRIICGHQDNGTNLLNTATWSEVRGGDGMDCFISWNNDNVMVSSTQYGGFARSTNGGTNWTGITNGLSGTAPWVSPIVQDPVNPTTFYCGYQDVFRSTNQGTSWTKISFNGVPVDEIKISPSNNQIIYYTTNTSVFKTINGGQTWTNITNGLPSGSAQITDLAIDNTNSNIIFVTLSGYSNGNKVFASYTGGNSWFNYSNGIPNIPVNCILYVNNSPQNLYVGTDVGVYYREPSMNAWIPFNAGLPNIVVDDMELFYPQQKLRAATYARGVWETALYSNPSAAPVSQFYNAYNAACINVPFVFNDQSSNAPTQWNWSFPGGSPSTSTLQNPAVTYSISGIYTITLISGNANGLSAPITKTIQAVGNPTVSVTHASVCINQQGLISVASNASQINWSTGQQGASIFVTAPTSSVYTFTASVGACSVSGTASLTVDTQVPITPTIQIMSGYLMTSVIATTYQWYLNGTPIPGATSATYAPTSDGYYSVWVNNGACQASSGALFYQLETVGELSKSAVESAFSCRPIPADKELWLEHHLKSPQKVNLHIRNVIGQTVYKASVLFTPQAAHTISIQGLVSGTYFIFFEYEKGHEILPFIKL